MKILDIEQYKTLGEKDGISGVCFINQYSVAETKTGSKYIQGVLKSKENVDFKIWGGELANFLIKENQNNKAVYITGKVNIWNGTRSIIVDSLQLVNLDELGIDPKELDNNILDIKAQEKEYLSLISENISPDAYNLFKAMYKTVRQRFATEQAAIMMHDARTGGLLHHTKKMLKLLTTIYEMYPNIVDKLDKDLVFIGLALHDVGKVYEYDNGQASEFAYVSHTILGLDLLFEFKDKIINGFDYEAKGVSTPVKGFGEHFYRRLQTIISQHHGEFGERPQTVEVYVVHLVDSLEAKLQQLEELLPNTERFGVEPNFAKFKFKIQ